MHERPRDDDQETVGELIADLAEDYGLDPNQRISTLIEAGGDDLLEEVDDDDDDADEFEPDDD